MTETERRRERRDDVRDVAGTERRGSDDKQLWKSESMWSRGADISTSE